MSRVRAARSEGGVTMWRCSKCETWLQASGFYPRKSARCGLSSWCRLCVSTATRLKLGYTKERTWGLGLPRRGSDWVAEARADEGPGKCVVGGELLPPGRRVLCGSKDCARTYFALHRQEMRVKAKAAASAVRRAVDSDLHRKAT